MNVILSKKKNDNSNIICTFANDTSLFNSDKNLFSLKAYSFLKMQCLQEWFQANKFTFNTSKQSKLNLLIHGEESTNKN